MKASEAIDRIRKANLVFVVPAIGIAIRTSKGEAESWITFSVAQKADWARARVRFTEDQGERYAWLGCTAGELVEPDAPTAQEGGAE